MQRSAAQHQNIPAASSSATQDIGNAQQVPSFTTAQAGGGRQSRLEAASVPAAAVSDALVLSPSAMTSMCRKRRRPGEDLADLAVERLIPAAQQLKKEEPVVAEYATQVVQLMRRLRENGALCDVVVRSGEVEVVAHRLVLAACSEYFRACLTGQMQESQQSVITLTGVDENALEELVSFAYCGKVNLTEDTVLELLVAANRLQMPQVVDQCCEFLLQRMDSTNCLTILHISNTYCCLDMRNKAEAYIHRYFESVYQGDEFLSLSLEQLVQLLSSESVSVTSEETIFKAAMRWVMHDFENRKVQILPLLKTVRLELVPTSFIADVIHQHELVQQCMDAEKLLLRAYRWHNSARPDIKAELWKFIRKHAVRPVIYALGGDDGHDDRNPYTQAVYLDTQLGQWHSVAPLKLKRSVCGAATLKGKIYVVGGYNGERAVETVEQFDPVTNTWTSVANISQRRCSCGCAVLNDELYVLGGVCGPLALKEVEKYDPDTNTWSRSPPMQDGRSGCGVAELDGLLYAVGGINGAGETVCTAEVFDPKTQTWQSIQNTQSARRSFGLASLNGLLYACGGNNGVTDLATLESYDPQTNRWRSLASMKHPRMYCNVCVLDGKLYAVGGLDGSTTLDVVEVYDPARNVWEEAPRLEKAVCGCGLTVVDSVVWPEGKQLEMESSAKAAAAQQQPAVAAPAVN